MRADHARTDDSPQRAAARSAARVGAAGKNVQRLTRLLVSVRSADEAEAALAAGADLIDVKEPRRGSLGRAAPAVLQAVAAVVGSRAPLSAALGELRESDGSFPRDGANRLLGGGLEGFQFAKLGLAGEMNRADWVRRWRRAVRMLPRSVAPVAVIYADWPAAESPAPAEIVEQGAAIGCRAVLLDTYEKGGGGLFEHLSAGEIRSLTARAREHGLKVVLAGSLGRATLAKALSLRPDYVAVRGAVCRGGRDGQLDDSLVAALAELLAAQCGPHAAS